MIRNNKHKYSISAMYDVLQIPRSTYYYEAKTHDNQDDELTELIVKIFKVSRNVYGQSSDPRKDVVLVQKAFASVKYNLSRLQLFHTDRGSEFTNQLIDQALKVFDIERSLIDKGHPMKMQ